MLFSMFWIFQTNLGLCVSVQIPAFNSLGYISKGGTAGFYGNSVYDFLRNCLTVFQRYHHFTFSPVLHRASNFSTFSSTLDIFCFLFFIIVILMGANQGISFI